VTAYGIQPDYGEFDTRFLGVNLRFHASHPSTWLLFDEISTEKHDPKRVMEMGSAALKESPERAFEIFSVGTVLTHEMRHFHDFLLSPYGNALFRLRLTIMLNGFQAILPVLQNRKTIPVPVPAWLSKSDHEKELLARMWAGLYKNLQPEPLDLSDDEELLITQTAKTYSRIKDFLINPQTVSGSVSFQPYHLLEASAFITQAQNVFSVFGLEHAQAFVDFIVNNPSAAPYSTVFRLLYNLWDDAGLPSDTETMNAIITWCLLGDFLTEGWDACPTVRFVRLYELLRSKDPPLRQDVTGLFDEWTRRLSCSPIKTAFERNEATTARFINHLEQNGGQYPAFMGGFVATALRALKSLSQANAYMSALLLQDPVSYVNPYAYVQNDAAWPAAPAVATFVGGGILMNREKMESLNEKGIIIQNAKARGADEVVVLKAVFPKKVGGVDIIDTSVSLETADLLTLSDFFFSEFRRGDPEFDWVRFMLRQDGVTPLEILM
jgi:hypothetical protein